ncbi:histidinol-phosphate transaminase [Rothia nasimurium]|uniref:Histidinol-phosphate aminotransferase n=1 Tax=Rothia nasimurium TaxID=85336 RepID=A0A1Y1RMA7_9MICC|nr:histidinol-phosphate transaminase [Rothia nasimurium]ORC15582.1 histidinol-phosphate transaminase [Rothia nasimurium]
MTDTSQALNALPLRDDLRGRSPYGAPMIDVPVTLNVNENTHPMPREVIDAIVREVAAAASSLNRYPDREFNTLREELASYLGHGLTPDNIWAANGSNEILQQIMQVFGGPGRSVMSFVPTYSMYPLLADGTNTAFIAGQRAADYTLSAGAAVQQIEEHRPDIVILCSPNNPTGTGLSLNIIEATYSAVSAYNGIVVVDEAYAEFAQDRSQNALTLLAGRPNLIVTRTMSKAFALAGARLGYFAAAPAVTDAVRLVRLPYHLSAVTQATAIAALRHRSQLLANVDDIRSQRDRIVEHLKQLNLKPAVSDSNFVFFGGLKDEKAAWNYLLERGVLVRDNGIPGYLRVTAGTEAETSAFLEHLTDYVQTIEP